MKTDAEQEGLLGGDAGAAVALAMKTLAEYGRAFGATRPHRVACSRFSRRVWKIVAWK